MSALTLQACAKVNLSLRVMGRRPDGFHNVETVLHAIGLWDTVRLAPREVGIALTVEGEAAPVDESNLCWRAAQALAQHTRTSQGVSIALHKRIPVGAGLGGGSSDAAAVLVGLTRLWNLALSPEELARVAGEVGSDVPFFLQGGCCLALGRGERLERLPSVALSLVVVVPERRVPTAQAYAALRRGASLRPRKSLSRATQRMVQAVKSGETRAVAAGLHNDFEALEMVGIADAMEAKAALLEAGCLGALLSGSGSAVFGIASQQAAAEDVAAALRPRWPWVNIAPTVAAEARMMIVAGEEERLP